MELTGYHMVILTDEMHVCGKGFTKRYTLMLSIIVGKRRGANCSLKADLFDAF
jgi:hypothetical protein